MKIAAIASSGAQGGAEIFLWRLCDEIAARGIPIAILAAAGVRPPPGPWSVTHGPQFPNLLRARGAGALRLLSPLPRHHWHRTLARARDQGADTLLCQHPAEQLMLTRPAKALGYQVNWVVHSRLHYSLSRLLLGPKLRQASAAADCIFPISASTRSALVAAGLSPDRMVTLTPAVAAIPRLPEPRPPKPPRLIVLSRLHRSKGVHLVLKAAAQLITEFPKIQVAIAGSGRYERPLRALTARLGLAHAVCFCGLVSDVNPLLAGGFALIHPTLDPGDSIPTVLLEAGAAALPVVASAWNGAPEVIEHGFNGLLVKPGSLPDLVAAIRSLLRDPTRAAKIGLNGRQRVSERFTASQVADRFLAALGRSPRTIS